MISAAVRRMSSSIVSTSSGRIGHHYDEGWAATRHDALADVTDDGLIGLLQFQPSLPRLTRAAAGDDDDVVRPDVFVAADTYTDALAVGRGMVEVGGLAAHELCGNVDEDDIFDGFGGGEGVGRGRADHPAPADDEDAGFIHAHHPTALLS
jgi:hypothetical protein